MRSNLTFGLAALAFGCGIAGASAATLDAVQARSTAAASSLMPAQGNFAAGFKAIKSHQGQALKENSFIELPATGYVIPQGLTRPDTGHAWRSGLAALTSPISNATATKGMAVQPTQGFKSSKSGLSAIRGKSSPRGSALVDGGNESQAGLAGLQRPEGNAWSDRGRESIRSDAVAPAPTGPSVK